MDEVYAPNPAYSFNETLNLLFGQESEICFFIYSKMDIYTYSVVDDALHWNAAYMKAIDSLREDCMIESYKSFCNDPNIVTSRIAHFCDLQKRDINNELPSRFSQITNQNEKYISKFPQYRNKAKLKAWDLLGYDI